MKRTALAPGPGPQRHTRLKERRTGGQRRAQHPFPLPSGEPITDADVRTELYAFGPQAELCRSTRCVACFYVEHIRFRGSHVPINWTALESYPKPVSHAHHEPHRSTRGDTLDEDTIPLCEKHHIEGVGDCVRHRVGFTDEQNARRFYSLLPFDWRAARDEMRRRTKSLAASAAKGEESVASPANATLPGERQSPDPIPGQHPTETTT